MAGSPQLADATRSVERGRRALALGSNAKFPSPPEPDPALFPLENPQEEAEAVISRYALRTVSRAFADSSNQQKCGHVRIDPDVSVYRRQDGKAHLGGLVTCASWSGCPVCSARLGARKGEDITNAINRHMRNGGDVLMVTATMPHDYGGELESLYLAMAEAWSFAVSGAPWKRWESRLGIVGMIRGQDCTHGLNGWHPHMHTLVFTARRVPADLLREFQAWLHERIARRLVEKHGIRRPSREHGLVIQRGQRAGVYVAKMGLARELSSMQTKEGRHGHRTPFQILRDYARSRRSHDLALWSEWVQAMYGKVQIRWSRGLRERLLDTPEQTDVELLAAEDSEAERLITIPGGVWDRIAEIPNIHAAVKLAAQRDGVEGVQRVLTRALRTAPARPPDWKVRAQLHEDRTQQQIRFKRAASLARLESRTKADASGYPLPQYVHHVTSNGELHIPLDRWQF